MHALNPAAIAELCDAFEIEAYELLDSTQTRARERVLAGLRVPAAVLADAQSAGRGRSGRSWQSPPGAAIYLTLVWPSARALAAQSGLSLVVGLAVCACLARWQVPAQLKWPNDVWVDGKKLGGILVEGLPHGAGSTLLIGIGLNLALPPAAGAAIDQPWVDLAQLLDPPPPRNTLIGHLLQALHRYLLRFELAGLEDFNEEWIAADALAGRTVCWSGPTGNEAGQAIGIDEAGRLRVIQDGQVRVIGAGEVRIRTGGNGDGDAPAAGPRQ
ncbi:MAG: biotin--[acetyl-CoA-carboxylase] ligase [Rhodanobacteraceae bacterium]|nr:biotin--[acetyl-CoA-carboxylase] ligase [Rhodanobacteraceae bacterium]